MTTAPATDLRLHYALFGDLLATALAPHSVYKFGEVPGFDGNPGTTPTMYALVDVQRRSYLPQKLGGRAGKSLWAVSVRGVGSTVSEVAWLLDRATDALEEKRITLDGHGSTLLTFDTHDPIEPDGGDFSGLVAFTYSL